MKRYLVCGIRGAERRRVSSFFASRQNEGLSFCEALVAGEGEAKKILSAYEIDEIVVIGSVSLLGEKGAAAAGVKMALNDGIDVMTADVTNLSGFDFFRYRMTQFTMGLSIDLADSLGEVDPERREQLVAFAGSLADDVARVLPALFEGGEIRARFDEAAASLSLEDLDWLFRYLYCEMRPASRMRPQLNNVAVPISFVPISSSFGFEDVTLFQDLLASLLSEPDTEAELYIDLHGLPTEASGICASTLYSLSDDPKARIHIVASASVHNADLPAFSWVDMEQRHYRIDKLMAGIRAFLNNGKTDILRSYWDEAKAANPNLSNGYVDEILMAMGYVDAGISLCNIDELTTGLLALRRLLNHPELAPEPSQQEDAFVVMMLRESVLRDYGALMDDGAGDELDPFELVKWGLSKKFFQQVITIIESQIPAQLIARGILYPAASDEEVLAYKKALNMHYWDVMPVQRWMFNDLDHYFIKFYGRFAVDHRNREVPANTQYTRVRTAQVFGKPLEEMNVLPAHSLLTDEVLLANLMERYYDLSSFRNAVNHAERGEDEAPVSLEAVSPVWRQAEEHIAGFIEAYEKALEAVGDKRPEDLKPLVSQEFRDYFLDHGPREDPDYNLVAGYTASNKARPRRGGKGGGQGGKGGPNRGGYQDTTNVPIPGAPAGENMTVTVSLPKAALDHLKSGKTGGSCGEGKNGEIVVRISFE